MVVADPAEPLRVQDLDIPPSLVLDIAVRRILRESQTTTMRLVERMEASKYTSAMPGSWRGPGRSSSASATAGRGPRGFGSCSWPSVCCSCGSSRGTVGSTASSPALIRRGLERWTDLPTSDMEGLVEMQGGYLVSELAVVEGDWIAGATLAELELTREGVVILGVSGRGGYLGGPTADTRIEVGNVLVAYGFEEELSELDRRRAGPTGDAAHQLACVRHGERVAADRKRWEETEPETSPAPDVEEQPTDT